MAEFIPDRLPARASRGEERTFGMLKKLPDDYLVYYEPNIENRHPDFIVIAPDLGVMVIEVKGWRPNDILRGNDSEVFVNENGTEVCQMHPLEQARNYQWRLFDACKKNSRYSWLLHKDGRYKNRFSFPFGHFVVLSNITKEQLTPSPERDFSHIFRPENTMTRDQLLALENASPEAIRNALKRYFDPYWHITPLTVSQVDVLRAVIHPEIILSYLPTNRALSTPPHVVSEPQPAYKALSFAKTSPTYDLKILDRKQETNSRKIGEGHRVLFGVAGSGKTVILVARAKWLHERDREAHVLVLCYNVALSVYLKSLLGNYPRIHVYHFDGWAKSCGVSRQAIDPAHKVLEKDDSIGDRLHARLMHGGNLQKYDAVLVDEAQDFHPSWYRCILEAMKDPLDGDLLIVCDGNQGIRPIGSISWKSLGIKASGRTLHQALDLNRNYRNTREILNLAALFADTQTRYNEDSIGIVPVQPDQAIRRGRKPILIKCHDHFDECKKVIQVVRQLLRGDLDNQKTSRKTQPENIGILYRLIPKTDRDLFEKFANHLEANYPSVWLNKNWQSRERVMDQGIKIQTASSSKGLQYQTVILMWADLFYSEKGKNDINRRLLYVALTRPEDLLIITYSKSTPFIDTMIQSGFVVHVDKNHAIDNIEKIERNQQPKPNNPSLGNSVIAFIKDVIR